MFAPKWKKEAKLLYKGAKKFLNYKRDLLDPEKVSDIEAKRADLLKTIKDGDQKACAAAEKLLTAACDRSLPNYRRQGWVEENIEVFFVAIVIAFGIRAYYLQPFRIPTGSMQPTLNGVIWTDQDKAEFPAHPVRWKDKVMRGRTYVYEKLDQTKTLASRNAQQCIVEKKFLYFFTYTQLIFNDGSTVNISAPRAVVLRETGLATKIGYRAVQTNRGIEEQINNPTIEAGTVLLSGFVDTGDLVLVDKVSYNFRRPQRGEVWVFDTRGIEGIHERSTRQSGGSHYIKRLVGVPGDSIQIQNPHLYINGKLPKEKKLLEVMNQEGIYKNTPDGYILASTRMELDKRGRPLQRVLDEADERVDLLNTSEIGMREYFALGDNTTNSLDSRYWGSVREYNAVGPALFSLWPFTSGHWGFIK